MAKLHKGGVPIPIWRINTDSETGTADDPTNVIGVVNVGTSDSPSVDAFGRWRSSTPQTIFDSKLIFDNAPLFWDDQQTSGSGTSSTYSQDNARVRMAVSNLTAGTRVRQTFMRFNYQPGKSQLAILTGVIGTGASGITKRIGSFDGNNGLFVEQDDNILYVVRRSSVTGSPVDTQVAQSDWNLDKLDGTGNSGVTLDLTKTQIMVIDYEWLGVGRVRVGFDVDGVLTYCHQFTNSNCLDTVYMSTPNNPLRYEISNDGTGPAASLDHICSTVISEGGTQDLGVLRYQTTAETPIEANAIGSIYVVNGIRLKTTHIGSSVKLESMTMISDTTDDFEWLLLLNPTLDNDITFSDATNSSVQTGVGNAGNPSNSTVSSIGTIIGGGFVKSGAGTGIAKEQLDNAILLGSNIAGASDEIYLCVRPLSVNANIYGSLQRRELS